MPRRLPVVVAVVVLAAIAAGVWFVRSGELGRDSAAAEQVEIVSAETTARALRDGATIIDVRTPREYDAGHLDGAKNIGVDSGTFDEQIERLDPEDTYVVYCTTGRRAAKAIVRMGDAGFTDLLNAGGYEDLSEEGLATAR